MRHAAPVALATVALVAFAAPEAAAQPGATPPAAPPAALPAVAPAAPIQPAYPASGHPGSGPSYTPAPYAPYTPYHARPAEPRALKSESTATWLSIGTTALGFGAIMVAAEQRNDALAWAGLAGMLVGPSAGHLYAGENSHAIKMSLLRTGGLVVLAVGALSATSVGHCSDHCAYDDSDNAEAAMWLGGALFVGATLYDFWDAGRAARRFNDKQQHSYLVAPTLLSSPAGAAPGFSLAGRF